MSKKGSRCLAPLKKQPGISGQAEDTTFLYRKNKNCPMKLKKRLLQKHCKSCNFYYCEALFDSSYPPYNNNKTFANLVHMKSQKTFWVTPTLLQQHKNIRNELAMFIFLNFRLTAYFAGALKWRGNIINKFLYFNLIYLEIFILSLHSEDCTRCQ